jgi:hypothetical protein
MGRGIRLPLLCGRIWGFYGVGCWWIVRGNLTGGYKGEFAGFGRLYRQFKNLANFATVFKIYRLV